MALINNIIQIEEFELVAGNTDIVYSVTGTLPNALIGIYCDTYGVYPVEVTKENNSIHVKYEAQATDINVALIFFKSDFSVVNNLSSTSETDALSAAQGKTLKDLIDALSIPALSDLTDVAISDPSTDDILIYDAVSEKWINTSFPAIPNDIDDLNDVDIVNPSDDDVLTYDNGAWINKPSQGGVGVNYSTTEQDTGLKWIDNKHVYQKSQSGGITFSNAATWYDTDITGVDTVISVTGSITRDGEPIPIGYFTSNINSTWVLRNNMIKIMMGAKQSGETYMLNNLTVLYTKSS